VKTTDVRPTLLLLAAIALMTVLVWWPSLEGPFYLDSTESVQHNDALRITHLSAEQLTNAAVSLPHGGRHNKRWLVALSFAADRALYGLNPAGYRATNIALHLLNGLLVFTLVLRLLATPAARIESRRALFIATAATALWLLNPVQTSAVSYVWARTALLATLFYLAAILAYLRARSAAEWGPRLGWGTALVALWLLAMASKEIAVTLPAILLLLEWLMPRKPGAAGSRTLAALAGLTLLCAAVMTLAILGAEPIRTLDRWFAGRPFTLGERVMTEWRVVVDYLGLLGWPQPSRLTLEHDVTLSRSLLQPPTTLAALAFIVASILGALMLAKRHPLAAFAVLWYYLHLVIESTVVPLELKFEHRLYLPSVGIMLLAALLLARLPGRRTAIIATTALGLLWAGWTWQRNLVWADPARFWQQAVALAPQKARPWLHLGVTQQGMGQLDAALASLDRSVALHDAVEAPVRRQRRQFAATLGARGLLLKQLGRYSDAQRDFERGYALDPRSTTLRGEIAAVKLARGDAPGAIADLDALIADTPNVPMAYATRGAAKLALGRAEEAIPDLNRALAGRPRQAEWINLRGTAYTLLADRTRARADFNRALEIDPGNREAQAGLARLQVGGTLLP
jgi:tetratricopeptide (TPR) repeat protein